MEYIPITDNKTTKEQSARLLELGLPAETADCYREPDIPDCGNFFRENFTELSNDFFKCNKDVYPVWTVGQLQRLIMKARGEAIELHPDISPLEACMRYAEITDFSKLEEGE